MTAFVKHGWCWALLLLASTSYAQGQGNHFINGDPLEECRNDTYTYKVPKNIEDCVGKERTYSKAAVACESTVCSEVGRDILQKGGHAVDAAVAVILCLGVQNPEAVGIGGSMVMTIYDRQAAEAVVLNGESTAPAAVDISQYIGFNQRNRAKGAKAIAIPGVVATLEKAHRVFGRLPWKDLFEPSIRMAEQGVPLDFATADALVGPDALADTMVLDVKSDPMLRSLYLNEQTDQPKQEGEFVFYKKLARTYRRLAEYGAGDFYRGQIAKDIVGELAERGGIITLRDLMTFTTEWQRAGVDSVQGYPFYTPSLPSTGELTPLFFRVLAGYNMTRADLEGGPERRALVYHRFLEACKVVYAMRYQYIVDPHFYPQATEEFQKVLTPEYADEIRSQIYDDSTLSSHVPRVSRPTNTNQKRMKISTSHISVVDEEGNAVSTTSSINSHMGCKVVGSRTGIFYNDLMNDFSYPGDKLNDVRRLYPEPGKRSLTNTQPFVMTDEHGNVKFVGGSSGGAQITATVAQILTNLFIFHKTLKESIDDSRILAQNMDTWLQMDFKQKDVVQLLVDRGHSIRYYCYIPSGFQGILVQDGVLHAYVDQRKFSCPAGY